MTLPRKFSLILLIIFGFGGGLISVPHASGENPEAQISEREYDFGRVWQGDTASHNFKLKNSGKKEMAIEHPQVTGPYTTVICKKFLPAGQEMEIIIALDTDNLDGKVKTGAILFTNDPAHPQIELKMQGLVTPMIEIKPLGAMFFSLYKGDSKEQSVTIVNNFDRPLEIKQLNYQSDRFQASLQTITEGKEYRLSVAVNPEGAPGRTMEQVTFRTNLEKLPEFKVGVNIFIKNDVYNFPDQVDFGTLGLEKIKKTPQLSYLLTQTVLVKSREGKNKDFQIKLDHELPFLSISKTHSNSETYRLDVSIDLNKLKPGKIDSFITVHTNDKEVPELKIPVKGEIL